MRFLFVLSCLVAGTLMIGCRTDSDFTFQDPGTKSPNLQKDKLLMWETTSINSGQASTHQAQAAAKRVFNTVDLIGLTRKEVVEALGDPKTSNDSIYNFPFYPTSEGAMVYRFDTGAYGWQFDIHYSENDRVTSVEHIGIE